MKNPKKVKIVKTKNGYAIADMKGKVLDDGYPNEYEAKKSAGKIWPSVEIEGEYPKESTSLIDKYLK